MTYLVAYEGKVPHRVAVDPVDLDWLMAWKWAIKRSRAKKDGSERKAYAYRIGRDERGVRTSLWLHKEICKKVHGKPSRRRPIADHKNGDSLFCKRDNLRWASPKENRKNIHGSLLH